MFYFALVFIQKLLKHSKSWIRFFSAAAGTQIEILSAFRAKPSAVLPAQELAVHVQDEKRGKDLIQVDLVAV